MVAAGQKQLNDEFPGFQDAFVVGGDLHPGCHGRRARCHERPRSLNIDETDPAGARRGASFEVAQRRDGHPGVARRLEDRLTRREGGFLSIEDECGFVHARLLTLGHD